MNNLSNRIWRFDKKINDTSYNKPKNSELREMMKMMKKFELTSFIHNVQTACQDDESLESLMDTLFYEEPNKYKLNEYIFYKFVLVNEKCDDNWIWFKDYKETLIRLKLTRLVAIKSLRLNTKCMRGSWKLSVISENETLVDNLENKEMTFNFKSLLYIQPNKCYNFILSGDGKICTAKYSNFDISFCDEKLSGNCRLCFIEIEILN